MIEYENLRLLNEPFEKDYENAFLSVLKKGWFILGEEVKEFEKEFAAYCGSSNCVGVASGLDAIYLSLLALNLPRGSEVIVPSNTYIATVIAVINAGLKPVLVEPDISTYNINPDNITAKITPLTKVILVVHLYGKPCDMKQIMSIAEDNKLYVVEDCAQAHGASIENRKVGTWGIFGAFSFYPTKNLGALGDAGAITTNSEGWTVKLRALRNYGSQKKYYNEYIGINSRLDELQAAFLRIKLQHLDRINKHKRSLADLYYNKIMNRELALPIQHENALCVYHIFNVRSKSRDVLKKYLEEKGIKTEIHYPVPPHLQNGFKHLFKGESYPISEEIHNTTLSLPISTIHTEDEIAYIAECLNSYQ